MARQGAGSQSHAARELKSKGAGAANVPAQPCFKPRTRRRGPLPAGAAGLRWPPVEALVILLVPLVALFVWAVAYFQPTRIDPEAECARRAEHIAWLEERLAHARRHDWDEQMMANLHLQLAEARGERK